MQRKAVTENMVNSPLNIKYVFKRERYLEKRKAVTESAMLPNLSNIKSKKLFNQKIEDFIKECTSYEDALYISEMLYNENNFDLLESVVQKIISDIIPLVENAKLNDCITAINSANIGNVNADRLTETAKMYKSIDRIIRNHKNLTRRFGMDNMEGKSDREKAFSVCEMVDTYSQTPYVKFNIVLEELAYMGFMSGNRMNDSSMVENVSEYFLMINENTEDDIMAYRNAIQNSKVISEGADQNINYLMGKNDKSFGWKKSLHEWMMNPDKDINGIISLIKENYDDIGILNRLIDTLNEYTYINSIDFNPSTLFDEFSTINENEAINIVNLIKENKILNTDDLLFNMRAIWEAEANDLSYEDETFEPESVTTDYLGKVKMHNLIVDSQSVGEFLDHLEKNAMRESPFRIEKVSNMHIDSKLDESNICNNIDAHGFVTMKLRSYLVEGNIEDARSFITNSVNCINNSLYGRDSIAYYTVNENGFDISLRSKYRVILTDKEERFRSFSESDIGTISEICRYGNAIESISENTALLNIVDKLKNDMDYAATVSVEEAVLIKEMLSPYIEEGGFFDEFIDNCYNEGNIYYDSIVSQCKMIKEEAFDPYSDNDSRIQICAEMLNVNKDEDTDKKEEDYQNLKKVVKDRKKNNDKKAKEKVSTKPDNDDKSSNPDKEKEDKKDASSDETDNSDKIIKNNMSSDTEEPPVDKLTSFKNKVEKGAIEGRDKAIKSINGIKLAWHGVKAKLAKASAKEQEISRDMDVEYNHLLKTISNAGPDHREEIITGEVNHSLSKIIKTGVALAGIGVLAQNMVVPAIGAIALFAKSKYTSNKEKKMILDEIDIELKILEREISRAEQSGSVKKYRQLLTIQKNLMRRRQEIYYGLAKKGKRIPMQATVGLRDRE